MNAGLDAFLRMIPQNKIVILGDMLELGEFSRDAHINILKGVRPSTKDAVSLALVFYELKDLYPARFFLSADDAKSFINWSGICR